MGLGLSSTGGSTELNELMRLSWILATLVNKGPIQDTKEAPEIRFTPGIADRGTWGCSLTLNFTREGKGRGESTHHGTVGSCIQWCRKELEERLGTGYVV